MNAKEVVMQVTKDVPMVTLTMTTREAILLRAVLGGIPYEEFGKGVQRTNKIIASPIGNFAEFSGVKWSPGDGVKIVSDLFTTLDDLITKYK